MPKIIRITTVPISLNVFCRGLLHELSHDYEIVAVASPGADLEEVATREQVRTVGIRMKRHIAPLSDLRALWQLFRLFRKERPDLVHSMTPKAGLLAMLAAKLAGVPVRLHTFTGLIWPTAQGAKRRLLLAMDRLLCAAATHLNPEGQGVAQDLATAGLTHKPLTVLGKGNVRGIDFSYYQRTSSVNKAATALRQQLGLSADDFLFLFVGRMVRDKGIAELITAFASLVDKFPNMHLLLVGDEEPLLDPLPNATQVLLQQLQKTHRVHRLPHQQDVRPAYAAAQTFVFPSYREGFPNVVLEAGAFSLPSIVTDINGAREIITNGDNGLIVPPHDATALSLAMEEMLAAATKDALHAMGERAQENVQQHFNQPLVWQQLKDYYQELLCSQPASST